MASEKSQGTKTAEARVLRRAPIYFRFEKKLISPAVASASDAAPVIFSAGSPTNSPPNIVANSSRVKVTGFNCEHSSTSVSLVIFNSLAAASATFHARADRIDLSVRTELFVFVRYEIGVLLVKVSSDDNHMFKTKISILPGGWRTSTKSNSKILNRRFEKFSFG